MVVPSCEISIAAHFVPERVGFLAKVLEAMAEWDAAKINVVVATNDLALARHARLAEPLALLEDHGFRIAFEQATHLEHPFHLTWYHKKRLREWFENGGAPDDLFIYVEDDIALSRENIRYFASTLSAAKGRGLIPGFVRYERNNSGAQVAIDFRGPQIVDPEELITIDDQRFVSPKAPYWAGFIMDRELCAEYLRSPWSDRREAEKMPEAARHSCRVHSAWGLTYSDVPAGFHSRCIVPVDDRLVPLETCRVLHAAGNYVETRRHGFGTVQMEKVFLPPSSSASLQRARWNLGQASRRGLDLLKRIMADTRGEG